MSFKEREEAFEAKYTHDEDLRFRTIARRNKLFGLWVAEQLGLSGEDANHYARTVVQADLQMPGDQDVFDKVLADLRNAGATLSQHRLEKRLQECFDQAKREMLES